MKFLNKFCFFFSFITLLFVLLDFISKLVDRNIIQLVTPSALSGVAIAALAAAIAFENVEK